MRFYQKPKNIVKPKPIEESEIILQLSSGFKNYPRSYIIKVLDFIDPIIQLIL